MKLSAIIFDLDLTLVDTTCVSALRKQRLWDQVYAGVPKTTLYQNVDALLSTAQSLGLLIGVVTTSPSTYANKVMKFHQIMPDALVAYHDAARKPSPEPMLLCAKRLGVAPSECLAIGDDPNDVLAGQAAGMTTMASLWGCVSAKLLMEAKPDYLASSPQEAAELVITLSAASGKD